MFNKYMCMYNWQGLKHAKYMCFVYVVEDQALPNVYNYIFMHGC